VGESLARSPLLLRKILSEVTPGPQQLDGAAHQAVLLNISRRAKEGTCVSRLLPGWLRNAFRQRDERRQSRLFARLSPRLRHNPNSKQNERISTMPFLLSHFSLGDKIENCSAQFLAVCWIVHVEFKNSCQQFQFCFCSLAQRSVRRPRVFILSMRRRLLAASFTFASLLSAVAGQKSILRTRARLQQFLRDKIEIVE
jgi:hypothetical protein